MPHLILTSALLFALLAVVAIALGACLGIARDVVLEEAAEPPQLEEAPSRQGQIGLAGDFGLGLRHHAANFAQDPGQPFPRQRSFNRRV